MRIASSGWRGVAAFLVGTFLAVGLVAVTDVIDDEPAAKAAANGADFDPGYIISDSVFFDSDAMTFEQIQTFLEQKAPSCATGGTCIDTFAVSTSDRTPDAYCAGYAGRTNESAAKIIYKVAESCGINPQVLIVLLQKEQGLITYRSTISNPNVNDPAYKKATGYACPDTSACDAAYYGFHNQLYSAARQFKKYTANPDDWSYGIGSNVIGYHPKSFWNPPQCGKATVTIRNQATANLYIYTPYVPNASALANLYGEGDSCASYGNRNFWRYFTDWFGSPTNGPFGRIDNTSVSLTGVSVSGWAIDPDTSDPIRIHVYSDGVYAAGSTAGNARPDVGNAYPAYGANHGYRVTVPLPVGDHEVCVYAVNVGPGSSFKLGCFPARIFGEDPLGRLDVATAGIGEISVRGWAVDPDATGATQIEIEINGVVVGTTSTGEARPDVGAVYPFGDDRGYVMTVPTTSAHNEVCVTAVNRGAGVSRQLGCKVVEVLVGDPVGRLDSLTAMGSTVTLRGWALDPETADAIRYHVYIDKVFVAESRAASTRADIGAAYPAYGSGHGYTMTRTLSPGTHEVCVYGINVGAGKNKLFGCKSVVAGSGDPIGRIDRVILDGPTVSLRGWMLDPDADSSIKYHLYVDGAYAVAARAASIREDIAVAFPSHGAAHGYTASIELAPGTHELCMYGISVLGGRNALIGCSTVVVN